MINWVLLKQHKSGRVSLYKKGVWPFTEYKVVITQRKSFFGSDLPDATYIFERHDKDAAFFLFNETQWVIDYELQHNTALALAKERGQHGLGGGGGHGCSFVEIKDGAKGVINVQVIR